MERTKPLDRWRSLRNEVCFGNTEPDVDLEALTVPQLVDRHTEELPALAAAISYDSAIDRLDVAERLNRKLINMNHMTPFESVQFNFKISGISKICGAQLSRHRIGQGHISGSRRFRKQEMAFVYPILDYFDEAKAKEAYIAMSHSVRAATARMEHLLSLGVKKADTRYVAPASTATDRRWWINARALRDFFRLRLAVDAESEIRRLAFIVLDIVMEHTPTLFEDIAESFTQKVSKQEM